MKKSISAALTISLILLLAAPGVAQQHVGINTTNPQAMLHVANGNILFSGDTSNNAGDPPASGAGTRLMWYPDKAAFRAGHVADTQWNKNNIGLFSTALGQSNIASGQGSFAIGLSSIASGPRSVALGAGSVSSGTSSTTLGINTLALGSASTAMGFGTRALGFGATSMGDETVANGLYATAMGTNTSARSYASLTIGQYNDSVNESSRSFWTPTDPVFIIGNGTSNTDRRNAFVVHKNGNTNINGNATITGNTSILGQTSFGGSIVCNSNATIIGNTSLTGSVVITGNATINGEVNGNETGTANLVPLAYGSIAANGTITTGTGNFTVSKTITGQYEITLSGIGYSTASFVTSVSVRAADGTVRIPVTTGLNGDLIIRTYNLSNTKVDTDFHFVVYRP